MKSVVSAAAAAGLVLACALTGCGGGGGASASNAGDSSPSTPPPVGDSRQTLLLTAENAPAAVTHGFSLAAKTLAVGQAAADLTEVAAGGDHPDISCAAGGLKRTLTDRDGDNRASPGDSLRVELANCWLRPMGGMSVSGVMSIDYLAPSGVGVVRVGTVTLESGFGWKARDIDVRIGGSLQFEQTADRLARAVRVRSSNAPLTWTFSDSRESVQETITGLDCVHEARRDTARSTASLAMHVASGLLGGSFDIATPTVWRSWFGNFPDAGEVQIRGARGSNIGIRSGGDGTERLNVTLNSQAIGQVALNGTESGLLWSATGWVSQDPAHGGYSTTRVTESSFRLVTQNVPSTFKPLGTALEWSFSRPLAATQSLRPRFVRYGGYRPDDIVDGKVTIEGALLTISPVSQLTPGDVYTVYLEGVEGVVAAADGGGSVTLRGSDAPVAVTIRADAKIVGSDLLLGPDSDLLLDASGSMAPGSRIASTRWRQLSGPPVTFDSPESPTTRVRPAGTANGSAVVEVEVVNTEGEVDRRQQTLRVVNSLANVQVWRVQVGGEAAKTFTSADAGFSNSVTRVHAGVLDVMLFPYRVLADVVRVGDFSYPADGNVVWASAEGVCTGVATGKMHMRELELDSTGVLVRLAFDLDQRCTDGQAVRAALRFNSSLPLAW